MLEESLAALSLNEDWEKYQKKAEEIGVNPLYFQLPRYKIGEFPPREISPAYRYLEVLTQERLTAESATRYIKTSGEILGIYESLAGVRQGILRNDVKGTLFFAKRLRPESKEVLVKEFEEGRIQPLNPFATRALRELSNFLFGRVVFPLEPWQEYTEEMIEKDLLPLPENYPNYAAYEEALYYLISLGAESALDEALLVRSNIEELFLSTLRSGKISLVNRLLYLRRELGIPDYGKTVEEVVGENAPYFTLPDKLPNLKKAPRPGFVPDYYFSAALYGGNPQLYDFLLILQGREPKTINSLEFFMGYFAKIRRSLCEEGGSCFYQILARLPSRLINSAFALDVDLAILSFAKGVNPTAIVQHNLGNVDILRAFLPYIKKEEIKSEGYPLTEFLLQTFA